MSDILLKDAVSCLSYGTIGVIDLHPHYKIRSKQRNIEDEWVFKSILNRELEGILKQNYKKFRLYYKHPVNPDKYDLIIIIDIDDINSQDITIITTYKQKIEKRVRYSRK